MKNYTITVNGVAYDVTVEEKNGAAAPVKKEETPAPAPAPVSAPAAKASAGDVSVESPMPGNIIDVKVKKGDTVNAGDTLIILEAMKMENDIVAPSNGTVASVNVSKGEAVEAGQVLLTID